jgi:cysteine desulfurase
MRSGTHNVPGICGLSEAVKYIHEDHESFTESLYGFKKLLIEELLKIEDVYINGVPNSGQGDAGVCTVTEDDIRKSAPHVVSASFKSIRSEVLLNALSDKGIYVSSGSACSSNRPELSGTLQAIGVEKALLDSTLRFSFSKETCEEDIRELIKALHDLLPVLRQFTVH